MLHFIIVVGMFTTLVYVVNREVTAVTPANIRVRKVDHGEPVAFAAEKFRKIDWASLRGAGIRPLDGQPVAIPGYVVPLEDNGGTAGEFLIVPYFGSCVHTAPPPANQMVFVKMTGGREIRPPYDAVWMYGALHIAAKESQYGKASFQMEGSHLEPFRE